MAMQIETATQQFLAYVERERGCTAATAKAYGSDLRRCIAYLVEAGVDLETDALTSLALREYVTWMAARSYTSATLRRRVSTLSSLYRWLIYCGHATTNPCLSLALPKKRRPTPTYLTLEEARRVLASSEDHPDPRTAFRNRAMMATLLFCGLRRAELLDLRVSDVDLRSRWVKVRPGKGVEGRSVPLLEEPADALRDWPESRPKVEHDFVFTGIGGRPLRAHGLQHTFRDIAKVAGVNREGVTLHTLRHTFASLLLQQGFDLVSIKEMLGHADLATTSVYLHLDAAHLKAAVGRHALAGRCGG
jgi:site-specific recombinase XerD